MQTKTKTTTKTKPFHVYAPDGFEGAFATEAGAMRAARRGAKTRRMTYRVIKCDAHGLTGGGHGSLVAEVRA